RPCFQARGIGCTSADVVLRRSPDRGGARDRIRSGAERGGAGADREGGCGGAGAAVGGSGGPVPVRRDAGASTAGPRRPGGGALRAGERIGGDERAAEGAELL